MTIPSRKMKGERQQDFFFLTVNINKVSKIQGLRVIKRRMDTEAASSVCHTGPKRKYQPMPKNSYPKDHQL